METHSSNKEKSESQVFRTLQQGANHIRPNTLKALSSKIEDPNSLDEKYLLNETRKWQLRD